MPYLPFLIMNLERDASVRKMLLHSPYPTLFHLAAPLLKDPNVLKQTKKSMTTKIKILNMSSSSAIPKPESNCMEKTAKDQSLPTR